MADSDFDRINREWQVGQDQLVPLSVAASMIFYQAHGSAAAIRSPADFNDALDLAASALSRLVAVYAIAPGGSRVALHIDLTAGSFSRGATQFRLREGSMHAAMLVRRGDAVSAMSLIRRTGIPFSFALSPDATEERALEAKEEKPRL